MEGEVKEWGEGYVEQRRIEEDGWMKTKRDKREGEEQGVGWERGWDNCY